MNISIIIPTFNQSRKLSLCLKHLSELNSSDQILFEVLVIDNGSTDNTKEITLSFKDRVMNLAYLYCAEPGLMAARHRGAEIAKGEILCYLDDDSLVSPDWLSAMAESFNNKDVVIAGGPCVPKYEVEPPAWVEYFWTVNEIGKFHNYLSLTDFGEEKTYIDPVYIFGCNYAINKKSYYDFGGARPDFYPDKYWYYRGSGETGLSVRIRNDGYNAFYHPDAKIHHIIPENRMTFDYFYWKQRNIGVGESYQFIRKTYGLDGYPALSLSQTEKMILKIRKPLGRLKRMVKAKAKAFWEIPKEPSEILSMRQQFNKSFQHGYAIHQEMVRNDPELWEWVLRENYLGQNGRLPGSVEK